MAIDPSEGSLSCCPRSSPGITGVGPHINAVTTLSATATVAGLCPCLPTLQLYLSLTLILVLPLQSYPLIANT